MKNWFLGLSKAGKVAVISVVSVIGIGTLGAFADQSPAPSDTTPTTVQSQTKQEEPLAPEITTKQVTETESVAFETATTNNASLA